MRSALAIYSAAAVCEDNNQFEKKKNITNIIYKVVINMRTIIYMYNHSQYNKYNCSQDTILLK